MTQITDSARLAVALAFIDGREHDPVGEGDLRLACWRTDSGKLLLGTGDGVRLLAGTVNGTLAIRADDDPATILLLRSIADGEWDPRDGGYPHATLVCTDDALLDVLDDAPAAHPVADNRG